MKVSTILDSVDLGNMALPEFQRGYVWNRDQVRGFTHSLYKRYPVGSLLVWVTKTEDAVKRGDGSLPPGTVQLLLDGQQRVTTLYGIIRGKPPAFFEGNVNAFTGLFFNLETEDFEFYAPIKMKDNPLWISVTDLMQGGAGEAIKEMVGVEEFQPHLTTYINRLTALDSIKNTEFHIEQVTGEDKSVDVVVEIFNKVNSGGTKLRAGDLALAKVCAQWPDARAEIRKRLGKWQDAGFDFRIEWLLRCVTAAATGRAAFVALDGVSSEHFEQSLKDTERAVDKLLNLFAARLGIDHDRVLGSKFAFPILARYLGRRGGKLPGSSEQGKLLYWYIHTLLWGRYSATTESVLNQDLRPVEQEAEPFDQLIAALRQNRGDLTVTPTDFYGYGIGARFYPLLYMLTRVYGARDWGTGVRLSKADIGAMSRLDLHHIFPKARLYKHGYEQWEVNSIANFTFLTQETNLEISDKLAADYLPHYIHQHPGAVESHWMPADPALWEIENYHDFLAERQRLLAKAANQFFEALFKAEAVADEPEAEVMPALPPSPPCFASDAEEQLVRRVNDWVRARDLLAGEIGHEIADDSAGGQVVVVDLAWPDGIQELYSQPVALIIDEPEEVEDALNRLGWRHFDNEEDFKRYVEREILGLTTDTVMLPG